MTPERREKLAIIFAALMIFSPFVGHFAQSFRASNWVHRSGSLNPQQIQEVQGWVTVVLTALTLFVLIFQAWIYYGQRGLMSRQADIAERQRDLMEGTLKVTQTAADAALAALARPWMFIEEACSSVGKWLEDGDADLIAKFTLSNYGNAPAHVSYLQVALFPGPHHHNGMPTEFRTERIIDFPEVESFEHFIVIHARQCDADGGFKSHAFNKVIRQNESVSVSVFGQPPLGPSNGPGLRLECTAEIYMIGRLYYAVPSQGLEQMTFCLKSQNAAAMEVFKDYPPFNERRKVLQSGGT